MVMPNPNDIEFSSTFLQSVLDAILTKKKPIRHRGRLSLDAGRDADGEWLGLYFHRARSPYVVVEFGDDQRANFYLRKSTGPRQGKILFRIEGMRVVNNPDRLGDLVLWVFRDADYSSWPEIERRWKEVALDAVG